MFYLVGGRVLIYLYKYIFMFIYSSVGTVYKPHEPMGVNIWIKTI